MQGGTQAASRVDLALKTHGININCGWGTDDEAKLQESVLGAHLLK